MELYKIFAIINRAIKGLHCIQKDTSPGTLQEMADLMKCIRSHRNPLPSGIQHLKLISTHLPLDKMVAISQLILSDAFSWKKSFLFRLKFHRNLFISGQIKTTHQLIGNKQLSEPMLARFTERGSGWVVWGGVVGVVIQILNNHRSRGNAKTYQTMCVEKDCITYIFFQFICISVLVQYYHSAEFLFSFYFGLPDTLILHLC